MRFYADLHIHSKFSRACSRDCDLEHLAWWAGRKGISVVGSGDFTHPAWREELGAKLVPDAPGLFRLRPELERAVHETLPPACRTPVRFMLSSEISTIYKRDDRTRKVHHLLYAPSLEAVDEITRQLLRIGNLASDGRPILGLDSRNLLEITLSGGDGCYLVPAHAWTPWFAVLGSQSGFDRVADCYADLAGHIFAVETGLSSDPEMNWRVSSLDGYRLVSNSDAHSPPMLGREATAFTGEADYFSMERALRTGDGFDGTVEFFPEGGKYHLDGHRACDVRTTPAETRAAGGKCPVCGKKPTVGVQHRVDLLADRPEGYRPPGAAGFASFVQLPEILGEIAGVGPKSKSVTAQVTALVERFGPELSILGEVPLSDLAAGAPSIVAEAIGRLRRGDVRREAGYDGVYGTIRMFDPGELAGAALFELPRAARKPTAEGGAPGSGAVSAETGSTARSPDLDHDPAGAASSGALDPEQHAIVTHDGGPLLVVAGPGAGKTRVLTHAIAHRIGNGLPPERCLAVTFTRRARDELRERLAVLLGEAVAAQVTVSTFHGLGLLILRDLGVEDHVDLDDPDGFDQLLTLPVALLGDDPSVAAAFRSRWTDVFVDEYQDVDEQQYRLLRLLTSADSRVCAIGDPDQAIYGFRGGDVGYFLQFQSDFDSAVTVQLSRSYRSAPTIVRAAMQLIRPSTLVPGRELVPARSDIPDAPVALRAVSDEREEAEAVATEIEKLIGGASFHALDSRSVDGRNRVEHQLSFSDFAVLYRTSAQGTAVGEALARRGFPNQRRSHARLAETPGVPPILAALGDPGMLVGVGVGVGGGGADDFGVADAGRADVGGADAGVAGGGAVSVAELLAKAVSVALSSVPAASIAPVGPGAVAGSQVDADLKRAEAIAAIRSAADLLGPLASRCGADLKRFLDEVALGAEVDTWDPRADRITLLTLHAAKGLEFPVVFIVGCDDGLLPLRPWRGAEIDYAEERRLLFVGMTRATTRLTLLTAAKRMMRGEVTECSPSPFLSSIDPALLDRRDGGAAGQRAGRRERAVQQTTLF
ncbi:MAG TPA: UvrD-helicase domain-containing protein [Trebonia sp.]|nr:UvrD-helicase domain-containing protein [Trebonia sp.]